MDYDLWLRARQTHTARSNLAGTSLAVVNDHPRRQEPQKIRARWSFECLRRAVERFYAEPHVPDEGRPAENERTLGQPVSWKCGASAVLTPRASSMGRLLVGGPWRAIVYDPRVLVRAPADAARSHPLAGSRTLCCLKCLEST